jgi:hypothetical protein
MAARASASRQTSDTNPMVRFPCGHISTVMYRGYGRGSASFPM